MPNGSTLYAWYDSTNNWIEYDVIVMKDTWLSIGYGTSMTDTDMAFWGANSTQPVMYDMYSTGHSQPAIDT